MDAIFSCGSAQVKCEEHADEHENEDILPRYILPDDGPNITPTPDVSAFEGGVTAGSSTSSMSSVAAEDGRKLDFCVTKSEEDVPLVTAAELNIKVEEEAELAAPALNCALCSFSCSNRDDLDLHVSSDHQRQRVTTASKCLCPPDVECHCRADRGDQETAQETQVAGGSNRAETAGSERRSAGPRHPCQLCGKTFLRRGQLRLHLESHSVVRPFACTLCDKSFKSKSYLTVHTRKHSDESPFACSHCDKAFKTQASLTLHMRIHTGKPYACELCGLRFSQKCTMTLHARTHTGEKLFDCAVCSKSFGRKAALLLHAWTHVDQKPLGCDTCGKTYIRRDHLTAHMHSHASVKPFSCKTCDKTFGRRDHLANHVLTHVGDRLFGCDACGKKFKSRGTLAVHGRVHAAKKRFGCRTCGEMFRFKKTLKAHRATGC